MLNVDLPGLESNTRGGSRRGTPGVHPPPQIGKNMILWRKIEIPQKFSRLPLLGAIIFKCAPPNMKSWIHPWIQSLGNLLVQIESLYHKGSETIDLETDGRRSQRVLRFISISNIRYCIKKMEAYFKTLTHVYNPHPHSISQIKFSSGRGQPNDFLCQISFHYIQWFWLEDFDRFQFSFNQKNWLPLWITGKVNRNNIGPFKYHQYHIHIHSNYVQWFLRKRSKYKITSDVKSSP